MPIRASFSGPDPLSGGLPVNPQVLIVDDHRMFQQGLKLLLQHKLGLTAVDEAQTAAEALEKTRGSTYELILMDLHLPDGNGIEVSRRILAENGATRIIMLSSDAAPARIDDALLAGVCGYVLKVNAPEELERAIAAARAGQRYLSPEANAALLDCYQRIRQSTPSTPPLSPREREVVRLIAAGRRTKEIADALGISVKSAETYRRRLMQKLGLFSVAELTRYALREKLVEE